MRSLMKHIDRFCYNHPRFGIPNLMIIIVAGTVLVWLLELMDTSGLVYSYLRFSPAHVMKGYVWQLFSFIFIPVSGSPINLFISLYFYYFIGTSLERQWGCAKFSIYFFSGVVLTAIYGMAAYFITGYTVDASAFYLLYSLLFAFAVYYGEMTVMLFFIIPLKMRYLAYLGVALLAYDVFRLSFPSNLLPVVAVLNFLIFCGGMLIDSIRPSKNPHRRQRENFKNEVRKIQWEKKNTEYSRKCDICGRTDATNPDLEFRYCSRCEGYHCFCIDHINNHVHFK